MRDNAITTMKVYRALQYRTSLFGIPHTDALLLGLIS